MSVFFSLFPWTIKNSQHHGKINTSRPNEAQKTKWLRKQDEHPIHLKWIRREQLIRKKSLTNNFPIFSLATFVIAKGKNLSFFLRWVNKKNEGKKSKTGKQFSFLVEAIFHCCRGWSDTISRNQIEDIFLFCNIFTRPSFFIAMVITMFAPFFCVFADSQN